MVVEIRLGQLPGIQAPLSPDDDRGVLVRGADRADGEDGAPSVEEKPYKVVFDANRCIGAGKCAAVSSNWELDLETGVARPRAFFFGEGALPGNLRAAARCPARKGADVIHVVDRRTGEELAPDPHGDGTLSVDW